jgi:hypothetical protein
LNPGNPDPAISDFSVLHTFIKVSSRCRVIPGILHVTGESRAEAKKIYRETNFERQPNGISAIPIYYNQDQDIVFFGDNACGTTIMNAFRLPIEISRVAISQSYAFGEAPCCQQPLMPPDGGGDIGPGELFASVLDGNFTPTTWNGWGGLRGVIFVVESDLAGLETSAIGASVALRSINGDAYANFGKKPIEPSVSQILNYDGADFDAAGKSKWQQEPKPEFTYMTRAPAFPGKTVSDYIHMHWRYTQEGREAPETVTDTHFLLREVARISECTINVSHKHLGRRPPLEPPGPLHLSIRGTSPAISLAKKILEMY